MNIRKIENIWTKKNKLIDRNINLKKRIKLNSLTSVVWSGEFVDTREFNVDEASDSTVEEYLVPIDKFDVSMLSKLLLNLNSIQGIAEIFRSPWVADGEIL